MSSERLGGDDQDAVAEDRSRDVVRAAFLDAGRYASSRRIAERLVPLNKRCRDRLTA